MLVLCRIHAEVEFVGERSVPGAAGSTRLRLLHADRVVWVRRQVPVQSPSGSRQLGEALIAFCFSGFDHG